PPPARRYPDADAVLAGGRGGDSGGRAPGGGGRCAPGRGSRRPIGAGGGPRPVRGGAGVGAARRVGRTATQRRGGRHGGGREGPARALRLVPGRGRRSRRPVGRRASACGRRGGPAVSATGVVAAIDCGTNSTRV